MDSKLRKLLSDFNKKLSEAQDARAEVTSYLEEHYDIDPYEECEHLEDDCTWCYGFNELHIQKLIDGKKGQ